MAATVPVFEATRKANLPAYTARAASHASRVAVRPAARPLAFTASPALLPACAFALGILLANARWLTPGYLILGVLLLATLTALAAWRAPQVLLLCLAGLFLLLGCAARELQPPVDPQQQLSFLAGNPEPQTVTGVVIRAEAAKHSTYTAFFGHKNRDETEQRVDLRLISYTDAGGIVQPIAGGLRLSTYTSGPQQALPTMDCGTRLTAAVKLHPESYYGDPGVWDAREWMHEQGMGALGSAKATDVRVLAHGSPGFPCWLHSLQSQASRRVMTLAELPAAQRLPAFLRLTPEDASMLTAMLTGDRSYLQRSTRTGFERTGSFHLLVVSGLHLAIFSSVVLLLARWLRLGRLSATALTITLSFAYALFTGYGQPVQRSFWMVTLFLLGRLLFRERHALQALGVAGLLLMAANPRALEASSLQMTLLTVVAIGGLAAPLAEKTFAPYLHGIKGLWHVGIDPSLPPKVAQLRLSLRMLAEHLQPLFGRAIARRFMPATLLFVLRLLELMLVSAVVELVMALPMAMYFHRITILGLPVNVLIIPFLGLLLPAAMLSFACLLVSPALALLPAAATAAILHMVSAIINGFANLPLGNFRLPAPPTPRIVLWVLLLAAAVYLVRRSKQWSIPLAVGLLTAAAALVVTPQKLVHRAGILQISTLDVGQGDSILVITPDGKTLLVDAGGLVGQAPGSNFDIGEQVVSPALWARGIRRLDAVAVTHTDMDHIGGMAAVLENFHPKIFLVGNNPPTKLYSALLADAAAEKIPVQQHRAGDAWQFGSETQVKVLWPSREHIPEVRDANDNSLVLRLAYGNTSALLEGDAEAKAEAAMLQAGLAHVDLLKVGHHGSTTSTIPAFLAALSPHYGAISCGRRNFYGHPRPATLDKLETAHVETLRTDLTGEADFFLDGRTVRAAMRSPSQ